LEDKYCGTCKWNDKIHTQGAPCPWCEYGFTKWEPKGSLRVYVAGAYSSDNVIGVLNNMREGMRWATKVFLAGHAPFCPWLDYHYTLMLREGENLTVPDYYAYSMAWLRVADVVFVTPGWEASHGTKKEIEEAERLGIRVVYRMEDI